MNVLRAAVLSLACFSVACDPDACLRYSDCGDGFVCASGLCTPPSGALDGGDIDAVPTGDATSAVDATVRDVAAPVDAETSDAAFDSADAVDGEMADASTD